MTTDTDMLARHLLDVWGYSVKVDDMPDELVIPFALQTLQKAAAELESLRAVVEAARYVVGETHGVYDDSVPDTFKAHLTVGDIRYLAAALERVTK